MAYNKVLVDNPTCSRRFHITVDDEGENKPRVEVNCPHCGVTIFAAENHPEVHFARDENLTKTTRLSDNLITDCKFEDEFSKKSQRS